MKGIVLSIFILISGAPAAAENTITFSSHCSATPDYALEQKVFNQAAEKQIAKNRCLNEQIKALRTDRGLRARWTSYLALAWMGMKKNELLLQKCRNIFLNVVEKADAKRYGFEQAWQRNRDRLKKYRPELITDSDETVERLKPLCLNPEAVQAMGQAQQLFQHALPVISTPDIFSAMEKNRHILINKETGRPFTNNDLLITDLRQDGLLRITSDPAFHRAIDRALTGVREDRSSTNKRIESSKNREGYKMSSNERDYIYQDGTVTEILEEQKLLGTSAGQCIMDRYEPSIASALAELAIPSAAIGKALGLAVRGIRYLRTGASTYKTMGFSRALVKNAKADALKGLVAVSVYDILKQMNRACWSEAGRSSRLNDMSRFGTQIISAADLPEESGFERWNITFHKGTTPSCSKDANLIYNSSLEASCAMEVIFAALPMQIMLPVIAGQLANNHVSSSAQ